MYLFTYFVAGADPGKNLTGLLDSECRSYGSPEACSPANVFLDFQSLKLYIFPSILSHLENLTDFRKAV